LENQEEQRGARQVLKEAASDPELQRWQLEVEELGGKPAARDPLEGLALTSRSER